LVQNIKTASGLLNPGSARLGTPPAPLTVGQQLFPDNSHIVTGKNAAMAEIPLPFGGLLGKDMPEVLLLVFNLAASRKGIPLGRAFPGLHLGHFTAPYIIFWFWGLKPWT
jgi:hypothetical protein